MIDPVDALLAVLDRHGGKLCLFVDLKHKAGGVFNVMGHPKSLVPYSLQKLDEFLLANTDIRMITFGDLAYLRDGCERSASAVEGNR